MGCWVEDGEGCSTVRLVLDGFLQCNVWSVHFLHIRLQEENLEVPQETVSNLLNIAIFR